MMTKMDKIKKRERLRIDQLHKHAKRVNKGVVPQRPGHVRVDGPRRQYRCEVRGGQLHYTEL